MFDMASQYSNVTVLIEIQEGITIHTFRFHKELLCSLSPFFQKAFQGSFLEARTGIMHISDMSAEHFGIFADWVATGQLEA
ncbi:hypothetical protein KCV07_g9986, partial [Aureobasidium melanogenum]